MFLTSHSRRSRHGKNAVRAAVDLLEERRLFAVFVDQPIADFGVRPGDTGTAIALPGRFHTTNLDGVTGTVVTLPVEFGVGSDKVSSAINFEMFDQDTPLTVQNFLNYVTAGAYENSIIHRSVTLQTGGLGVIQGGGFTFASGQFGAVPTNAPVVNEFQNSPRNDLGEVNTRGTVAMAKTSDPDSATNQWFINTTDNAGALDNTANSGGFTTFARVIGGMSVADQINALPIFDASGVNSVFASALQELPLADYQSGQITAANLARFHDAAIVSQPTTYFTYSVSSSNSALVSASMDDNGNLIIGYPSATRTGSSTITVTASDLTGATVTDTFNITVATPKLVVSYGKTKIASDQTGVVDVGTSFRDQVSTRTLTLTNGGKAILNLGTISLPEGFSLAEQQPSTIAPGTSVDLVLNIDTSADATLQGTILIPSDATSAAFAFPVQAEVGSGVRLGGAVKSVVFTDSGASKATFSLKGAGTAQLEFTGDNLAASTVNGVVTVTGANVALTTLTFDNAATGATTLTTKVKGGDNGVDVGTLSSPVGVKSLMLKGVTVTDAISFPAGAGAVTIDGADSAAIDIGSQSPTATVGNLALGMVSGGSLVIAGIIKSISAQLTAATLDITGPVKKLTLASVTDSNLTATSTLSSVIVKGDFSSSTLVTGGAIGKFQALSMIGSTISIALAPDVTTPVSADDFLAGSSLNQFTLKSKLPDAFSGSVIQAATVRKMALGQVTTAGTASSIVSTSIGNLGGKLPSGKPFSFKAVTAGSDVDDQLVADGIPASRLDVDLI